jgi:hypothetical protein
MGRYSSRCSGRADSKSSYPSRASAALTTIYHASIQVRRGLAKGAYVVDRELLAGTALVKSFSIR